MKFHEWFSTYCCGYDKRDSMRMSRACCDPWIAESRPYYKCYPAIMDVLQKVPLDMRLKDANLSPRVFLIRFAEGKEPIHGHLITLAILTCVRLAKDEQGNPYRILIVESLAKDANGDCGTGITWYCENDNIKLIDDELRLTTEAELGDYNKCLAAPSSESSASCTFALRAALTIHLLADDPRIITPDVLSKDRDRYDHETDEAWKQRAVERAKRRGVVGWNIGARYEVIPHIRRYHPHLYHTGKGRTVPRIVFVGPFPVHRSRLTEVPTGYQLPDGTEIEHGKVVSND